MGLHCQNVEKHIVSVILKDFEKDNCLFGIQNIKEFSTSATRRTDTSFIPVHLSSCIQLHEQLAASSAAGSGRAGAPPAGDQPLVLGHQPARGHQRRNP